MSNQRTEEGEPPKVALRLWNKKLWGADPSPNWSIWRAVDQVRLYEAVALSCSIEPIPLADSALDVWQSILPALHEKAKSAVDAVHLADEDIINPLIERGDQEIRNRLFVAERNLDVEGGLQTIEKAPNCVFSMVSLSEFARWAQDIDWRIPDEMVRLAKPSTPSRWPWGDYNTDLLQKLDATIRKWWVNYDPQDASTAPTDAEVTNWLQEKKGVSQSQAKRIARIIRADGLPSGPRRRR